MYKRLLPLAAGTLRGKYVNFDLKNTKLNFIRPAVSIEIRYYAHAGKDKKGSAKGKGRLSLTFDPAAVDFSPLFSVADFKQALQEQVDRFKEELIMQCSMRPNLNAFEELGVKLMNGSTVPLSHVATVALKNPQLVIIQVSSTDNMKSVKEALEKSSLNINPQMHGLTLHLPLPKVTRERREEMVKKCEEALTTRLKKRLDDFKSKTQRSWALIDVTPQSMSKEDLVFKAQKYTDQLVREYYSAGEVIMKAKQEELMKEL